MSRLQFARQLMLRRSSMLLILGVGVVLFTLGNRVDAEKQIARPASARLIVVSPHLHLTVEYLVLESNGDKIDWKFYEPRCFTEKGVDPKGEVTSQGSIAGNATQLITAFEKSTKIITDKSPKYDHTKPGPGHFSLMLITGDEVQTCELWSNRQRKELVIEGELKDLFTAVRKNVFGKSYSMPSLLRVGKDTDLQEPEIPSNDEWILPTNPQSK